MPLLRTAKLALLLFISACGPQKSLSSEAMAQIYASPLSPPDKPLRVFHLGHSLVGRDMPAMLEQLAGTGHDHRSQLGWGTTLKAHWEPEVPINGFEQMNAHPKYEDALSAVRGGRFDAVVLTEMVEIKDAIKYFDSAGYLRRWTQEVHTANPKTRVYLYETWHRLDDAEGWMERLDRDLARYWEKELLARSMADSDARRPVYVIPAGQVMARLMRKVEQGAGELPGLKSREDLFSRNPDGTQDNIHLSDLGNYLVALTHYAVLYHRSPVGLPYLLTRADGTPASAPSEHVARLMQSVVWEVVTSYPKTGVAQRS
jgi:hypothetical protein